MILLLTFFIPEATRELVSWVPGFPHHPKSWRQGEKPQSSVFLQIDTENEGN